MEELIETFWNQSAMNCTINLNEINVSVDDTKFKTRIAVAYVMFCNILMKKDLLFKGDYNCVAGRWIKILWMRNQ